jgi:hypothetical protein
VSAEDETENVGRSATLAQLAGIISQKTNCSFVLVVVANGDGPIYMGGNVPNASIAAAMLESALGALQGGSHGTVVDRTGSAEAKDRS